ncbi:MAG: helix-turn-helix domain-containing protein [Wolinella sp.]
MSDENIVKKACEELGITQKELADLMGIHFTTFSKWKDGIPKSSEITINLLIENRALKRKLAQAGEALRSLKELEKF